MISVLKFIGCLAFGASGLFFILCCALGSIYIISLIWNFIKEEFFMSFAKETENIVELAIKKEYENACEQYGDKYLCMQEMLQVLSEEVKEVYDELELAENEVIKKQFLTKSYNTETLLKLESYARNAMKELAQVGAVLMKIKNTFGKDINVFSNDEVKE